MKAKTLYLGLNPSETEEHSLHFPLIRIQQHPVKKTSIVTMMKRWDDYTHLVLTSKSAVRALNDYCEHFNCERKGKITISVGKATAKEMEKCRFPIDHIAQREQAEGVVEILETLDLKKSFILWPHSALSRSVLSDYFRKKKIAIADVIIYETLAVEVSRQNAPDLNQFEKIVFTSPSTVDAFVNIYGSLDVSPKLIAIGPITRDFLNTKSKQ